MPNHRRWPDYHVYDTDGNLIFDGHWHYKYDLQDRLIALDSGSIRIEYEYDPFHRRLSKKRFIDGRQINYKRYKPIKHWEQQLYVLCALVGDKRSESITRLYKAEI